MLFETLYFEIARCGRTQVTDRRVVSPRKSSLFEWEIRNFP